MEIPWSQIRHPARENTRTCSCTQLPYFLAKDQEGEAFRRTSRELPFSVPVLQGRQTSSVQTPPTVSLIAQRNSSALRYFGPRFLKGSPVSGVVVADRVCCVHCAPDSVT